MPSSRQNDCLYGVSQRAAHVLVAEWIDRPAKERLVEAIGVRPWRTQVKRRKASGTGESACSDEAQYLLVFLVYWRRHGHKV
jgi:hypothetical protein